MDIIKTEMDVTQAERETMSLDKKIYRIVDKLITTWININIYVMSTSFKVYIIVDKLIMTRIKINIPVMLTSSKVIFASIP